MTIVCDKCQHENAGDSHYCSQCGAKLPLDAVPQTIGDSDIEKTRKFVTQYTENIKVAAERAKYNELKDFHNQATDWVNNQFRVAKILVAAVVAFAGFLGYSSWDIKTELQAQADNSK